ncbi:hypothetical protein GTCCBUS3UF5_30070 [Geobacillus thermoleovorans CCB_US3_UF5]|uniref:Uncharacterized protein n=1 Tax=Geobacillus thermoleovorans CCB_US3_UF5 TaxID=1111068 RepID=A0ABM5MKK2_GEOTH|nr:hypothetical protein GTCCBUS3UF5_30070 [Geobacillus thermoleovorans CCB_US3_UF5]GAJ57939.1 hypothetical protein B23_1145 [Geobacillus thermoleovorans B23]
MIIIIILIVNKKSSIVEKAGEKTIIFLNPSFAIREKNRIPQVEK